MKVSPEERKLIYADSQHGIPSIDMAEVYGVSVDRIRQIIRKERTAEMAKRAEFFRRTGLVLEPRDEL